MFIERRPVMDGGCCEVRQTASQAVALHPCAGHLAMPEWEALR